jgi:hypothetical protein
MIVYLSMNAVQYSTSSAKLSSVFGRTSIAAVNVFILGLTPLLRISSSSVSAPNTSPQCAAYMMYIHSVHVQIVR